MTDNLLNRYREQLLALNAMPDGDARSEAAFELTKEIVGPRSRWADSDPEVAARWLVARGADINYALVTAAKFEHDMRTLYALEYRDDAATFEALAAFIAEVEGRSA